MRKLNLVLITFAFMMLVGIVFSFSIAIAEDQQMVMQKMDKDKMQPCGDPNCGTDRTCKCGDGCQCPAAKMARDKGNSGMGMACPMMKDNMGDKKGMDMKKMDMGKGMSCQCQMMDKMNGNMQMDNMPMGNMQMGNMKMGNMPMKNPDMMDYIEKLQLTQEQRDKIDSAKIAHTKDMIRKNADRDIAQIELDEIMRKDEPNLTAIGDQLKKIANMEADLKFAQIKVMLDIKALLTKEQKDNLKMMMERDRMNMSMKKMEQQGMQQPPAPGEQNKPAPEPMKDMKMK
jgi:Spy/CpxP family protein refolding chaperone